MNIVSSQIEPVCSQRNIQPSSCPKNLAAFSRGNDAGEGTVNLQTAVVVNQTQLPELVKGRTNSRVLKAESTAVLGGGGRAWVRSGLVVVQVSLDAG